VDLRGLATRRLASATARTVPALTGWNICVVDVIVAVISASLSPRNATSAPAVSASDIRTPPCKIRADVHSRGDQGRCAITRSRPASSTLMPSSPANGMRASRSFVSLDIAPVWQTSRPAADGARPGLPNVGRSRLWIHSLPTKQGETGEPGVENGADEAEDDLRQQPAASRDLAGDWQPASRRRGPLRANRLDRGSRGRSGHRSPTDSREGSTVPSGSMATPVTKIATRPDPGVIRAWTPPSATTSTLTQASSSPP
jgi:hypothetical protein